MNVEVNFYSKDYMKTQNEDHIRLVFQVEKSKVEKRAVYRFGINELKNLQKNTKSKTLTT